MLFGRSKRTASRSGLQKSTLFTLVANGGKSPVTARSQRFLADSRAASTAGSITGADGSTTQMSKSASSGTTVSVAVAPVRSYPTDSTVAAKVLGAPTSRPHRPQRRGGRSVPAGVDEAVGPPPAACPDIEADGHVRDRVSVGVGHPHHGRRQVGPTDLRRSFPGVEDDPPRLGRRGGRLEERWVAVDARSPATAATILWGPAFVPSVQLPGEARPSSPVKTLGAETLPCSARTSRTRRERGLPSASTTATVGGTGSFGGDLGGCAVPGRDPDRGGDARRSSAEGDDAQPGRRRLQSLPPRGAQRPLLGRGHAGSVGDQPTTRSQLPPALRDSERHGHARGARRPSSRSPAPGARPAPGTRPWRPARPRREARSPPETGRPARRRSRSPQRRRRADPRAPARTDGAPTTSPRFPERRKVPRPTTTSERARGVPGALRPAFRRRTGGRSP